MPTMNDARIVGKSNEGGAFAVRNRLPTLSTVWNARRKLFNGRSREHDLKVVASAALQMQEQRRSAEMHQL